jgi:hypothetical protein
VGGGEGVRRTMLLSPGGLFLGCSRQTSSVKISRGGGLENWGPGGDQISNQSIKICLFFDQHAYEINVDVTVI